MNDAAGQPLLGVTVLVEGTTTGTSTGIDGTYEISCAPDAELTFSFMGWESRALPVADPTLLDVTLAEDSQMVDDVIVIGYGTTTRRSTVGAVDQIKSEAIAERSVANLTQALQGTSPSLVIQQRSSDPADNQLNINIRGIGTMNNNQPLIVIDGLVSDNSSFNKLNPSDIENVSVLKDAGTAAIYGSRAANGVLLVTTKKGKLNQAPTVELTAQVGWQQPDVLYTPVEGWQNATLLNIAKANAGLAPAFTAEQIRDLKEHGNGTFFMDEIFQTAMQQNYNVSVSGGGANTTYMVSAGYFDQESNYVGPDYGRQRYNFRTNLTTEYKRVKVTALLSYSHENSKTTIDGNAIANASRIPTYYYYRQYDPATGKYLLNDKLTDFNSLGLLQEGGYNRYRNDYVNANLSAEVKIIDGLKLRGVLGADIFADHRYTRTHEVIFYNTDAAGNPIGDGRSANNDDKSEDWNQRAYLINSDARLRPHLRQAPRGRAVRCLERVLYLGGEPGFAQVGRSRSGYQGRRYGGRAGQLDRDARGHDPHLAHLALRTCLLRLRQPLLCRVLVPLRRFVEIPFRPALGLLPLGFARMAPLGGGLHGELPRQRGRSEDSRIVRYAG